MVVPQEFSTLLTREHFIFSSPGKDSDIMELMEFPETKNKRFARIQQPEIVTSSPHVGALSDPMLPFVLAYWGNPGTYLKLLKEAKKDNSDSWRCTVFKSIDKEN